MPLKHILALSLPLALTTWTLTACGPSAPLAAPARSPSAAGPQASGADARSVETLTLRLSFGQTFQTQLARPGEVAFVKVSVSGDGIASPISHAGAAFLPVVNGQVSATVSGIPQKAGDLRIVSAQAYDAGQTLLPALAAGGAYRSSASASVSLSLSRRGQLLAAVMRALSASEPATADLVDLTVLQSRLDTLTGYSAGSGSFTTDPSRFSPTAIAAAIGDDGSLPDAASLSAAALLTTAQLGVSLSTPDGLPIAERLRLLVDDPGSLPVMIPRLSASGTGFELGPVAPGTWTARVENEAGELLASTSVSADGLGGISPANPVLSLEGVQQLRGETLVNRYTSMSQGEPQVAMDDAGNYVVVWMSLGQLGSTGNIFAQRFDRFGAPQGAEVLVNSYTSGLMITPDIAMDADGDYVVAWSGEGDTDAGMGVFAQRFSSSGQSLGAEIHVNSYTTGSQYNASLAMADDGSFVISWQSQNQDGNSKGVFARQFDATGAAGTEFQVNAYTTSEQSEPTAAMDADGDFVIAWQSNNQDDPYYGIFARRYDRSGSALSGDIHINTYTSNWQANPAIAMDATGDFALVWASTNQDGSDKGIVGRRFEGDGTPKGPEFAVNTETLSAQSDPEIACDSAGDLVIAWATLSAGAGGYELSGRRYDRSGTPRGDEFRLNTYLTQTQHKPVVAMDADGDFVAIWNSMGQDGSLSGVYAQRYDREGQAR